MSASQRLTMRRTLTATLAEVWELWTTKDGIESWWGPKGFRVEVDHLDLRDGGQLRYRMIATDPDTIRFIGKAGMPFEQAVSVTFGDVVPLRRLVLSTRVDFVPGMASYAVESSIELEQEGSQVHMTIHLDPMHDQVWSERSLAGWHSQLDKLDALFAGRSVR